jgi:protein-tyrosine-phosphatase
MTVDSPAFKEVAIEALKKPLRAGRNALRATVERLAHPRRRRDARRRLRQRPPQTVLFMCEGNIYRSPYAAACLCAFVPEPDRTVMRVSSAGFVGPNRPSPPDAQALARARGLDLGPHRSRLIDPTLAAESELIVVMEARQARVLRERFGVAADRLLVLGDLDPQIGEGRTIADPWKSPETMLEGSYARVERCVRELASLLSSAPPTEGTAPSRSNSSSEPPTSSS